MPEKKKKVSRKKPVTPRSKIKNCLRQLVLRSRERAVALKATEYRCIECDVKQSKAKGREVAIQCHHDPPLEEKWEAIIDQVVELLASPQFPLCLRCHDLKHDRKHEE